ncbi:alanine--tRNA ligase [Pararhizobium sp. IMCC21322]|uniref:alanine--tRNA ligase n=1 Tax=Pararhizobium sp. IMCC21322 TaxID=3067903 RepID=UPI002741045F|nr:alanine--tRNA ligase [Pararhizobium sp. IMCC21322]
MAGVNEIRSAFLNFFEKNGHKVLPSSPLVPLNDPTLMFTNAGMVQFKDYFTGAVKPEVPRAATSQKCVRAGGKHNDLDNVGYTARHHTFFEMLGNFSFGDYFKEQAIHHAWTLITGEYGLPKDKLLVTVFHEDDEAFDLWKKIAGLPDEKIIRIATHDNFWAMGDTGPCGPCSEIFYDHGENIWGGPPGSPEEDGDRFIEIWNLVFMQYEQTTPDERVNLPKPSIDTGMGLERIAAVLQGVHNNYDIDLFKALIAASVEATGVAADADHQSSHRIIADHLRATSFLLADGVMPSNEGRGYVLRRIMRRAMRHASLLGAEDPLIHRLVPTLVREMGQAFPELQRAEAMITETLRMEEVRFRKTLSRGLTLLDEASLDLKAGDTFDGRTAFTLYDTYGFPLDLTQDALRAREIGVDTDAFNVAMTEQKTLARANWAGSGDAATETVWLELSETLAPTEFLGYEQERAEGQLMAIIKDGASVDTADTGDTVQLVFNQTPFYAESGGQVGDTGTILVEGKIGISVSDVQKKAGGLFVHKGKIGKGGSISVGDSAALQVDNARRSDIRKNHSATHLIHEALRRVLGPHVAQKGSRVAPDSLRFDFSHQKGVSDEEMAKVEAIANDIILQSAPVTTRLMAVDDAIEAGAMALFGEKYGDEVRVVSMGLNGEPDAEHETYSAELCGGTHVGNTGEIGLVAVTSEGAVASGIRRIEAFTGVAARNHLKQQEQRLRDVADVLKSTPADAVTRVESLLADRKRLEKELGDARAKLALTGLSDAAIEKDGFKYLGRVVEGVSPKDLRGLVDQARQKLGSSVVVLIAVAEDGKAAASVGVSADMTERFSAVDLVKTVAAELGGKGGGGKPDLAQAGGPNGADADKALTAVEAALS